MKHHYQAIVGLAKDAKALCRQRWRYRLLLFYDIEQVTCRRCLRILAKRKMGC